mgnify:CR=1 FL=1
MLCSNCKYKNKHLDEIIELEQKAKTPHKKMFSKGKDKKDKKDKDKNKKKTKPKKKPKKKY